MNIEQLDEALRLRNKLNTVKRMQKGVRSKDKRKTMTVGADAVDIDNKLASEMLSYLEGKLEKDLEDLGISV